MATGTMTAWNLTAETREWVGPITVTADGVPITTFKVSLTKGTARPTVWNDAYVLEGQRGILVGVETDWPLSIGQFTVWVKFADTPEAPVERVGTIKVT